MRKLNTKIVIIGGLILFIVLLVSSYVGHTYFTPLRAIGTIEETHGVIPMKHYGNIELLSSIRFKGREYLLTYRMSNGTKAERIDLILLKRNPWGWERSPNTITRINASKIQEGYYAYHGRKSGEEWVNFYGYVHSSEAEEIMITLANDESFKVPIEKGSFITVFKIEDNNGFFYPKKVVVLNTKGEQVKILSP